MPSQAKKLTFDDTYEFQITFVGKSPCLFGSKALYRDLTINLSSFDFVQTTWSYTFLHTILPCNLWKNAPNNDLPIIELPRESGSPYFPF